VAGVALCLGLAGIVTGLVIARRERASDAHLTADALQREELRDGWRALGAAAARDAQTNDVQAKAPASTAAAQPNVVIINVPAQSATAPAPPNVTNINLPSGPVMGENGTPVISSSPTPGNATTRSLPEISYSPMQGYLPTQTGYTSAPAINAPGPAYSPQNSYGSPVGSPPPVTPPVGNGSIPGSTPNPALPNNGLVGVSPPFNPRNRVLQTFALSASNSPGL